MDARPARRRRLRLHADDPGQHRGGVPAGELLRPSTAGARRLPPRLRLAGRAARTGARARRQRLPVRGPDRQRDLARKSLPALRARRRQHARALPGLRRQAPSRRPRDLLRRRRSAGRHRRADARVGVLRRPGMAATHRRGRDARPARPRDRLVHRARGHGADGALRHAAPLAARAAQRGRPARRADLRRDPAQRRLGHPARHDRRRAHRREHRAGQPGADLPSGPGLAGPADRGPRTGRPTRERRVADPGRGAAGRRPARPPGVGDRIGGGGRPRRPAARATAPAPRPPQARHRGVGAVGGAHLAVLLGPGPTVTTPWTARTAG